MVDSAVLWAAYGSTFAILSFSTHLLVHKDEASQRYKLRWDYHYTSNFKAAVAIAINLAICIALEEWFIQPYLISLFELNSAKIIQLLGASVAAFFLTIWWHTGVTKDKKKIAGFVVACLVSAYFFLDGFRLIKEW